MPISRYDMQKRQRRGIRSDNTVSLNLPGLATLSRAPIHAVSYTTRVSFSASLWARKAHIVPPISIYMYMHTNIYIHIRIVGFDVSRRCGGQILSLWRTPREVPAYPVRLFLAPSLSLSIFLFFLSRSLFLRLGDDRYSQAREHVSATCDLLLLKAMREFIFFVFFHFFFFHRLFDIFGSLLRVRRSSILSYPCSRTYTNDSMNLMVRCCCCFGDDSLFYMHNFVHIYIGF